MPETINFPRALDDDNSLYLVVNNLRTRLSNSITDSTTTISVTDTTGFPEVGFITILSVEDITQEVFIKAYRAMAGFRGDSAFYTWIYRIAINTAKNYLESQGRRPPNTDVEPEVAESVQWGEGLRELATPERSVLTDEIIRTVNRTIQDLPVDLRTAIMLRELEGLSYDEIAQIMDCPIGTVRSRIFRAREAIDKELKPLLER